MFRGYTASASFFGVKYFLGTQDLTPLSMSDTCSRRAVETLVQPYIFMLSKCHDESVGSPVKVHFGIAIRTLKMSKYLRDLVLNDIHPGRSVPATE